jgi:L-lactate dehydrogenase complex protein LldG
VDRDLFLTRVGDAIRNAELPSAPTVGERLPEVDLDDLVGLFRQRAQDVNAVVHGPMTRHGVARAVAGIASGHGAGSFIAWNDLPVSGVASALQAAGLDRLEDRVPDENRQDHQLGYRNLDIGVTGSIGGLAESGSVILSHGPGRPRMASLVPEIHIAILEIKNVDRTLAHWAHRHPAAVADTANLVIVTGPSRTGDIELQLNLGVHGPRHLHVVMMR